MTAPDYTCPDCGCECERLVEGYCDQCAADGQAALDLHNAEHDRWASMSSGERDAAIRWASR